MFRTSESEKEYRFGDNGPKYLMRGPRLSCGVVALQPGQDFKKHLHQHMEENFLLVEGEIDIYVDDKLFKCKKGDLIHVEPNEKHYLVNTSKSPAKAVFALGPFQEKDKIEFDS